LLDPEALEGVIGDQQVTVQVGIVDQRRRKASATSDV